jgi:hypothetical protein
MTLISHVELNDATHPLVLLETPQHIRSCDGFDDHNSLPLTPDTMTPLQRWIASTLDVLFVVYAGDICNAMPNSRRRLASV